MNQFVRRQVRRALGGQVPTAMAWVSVRSVPKPPDEVHRAAGGGRLKPERPSGLAIAAYALAFPVWIQLLAEGILELVADYLLGLRDPEVRRLRRKAKALGRGKRASEVFDGNWAGMAGQLLLRWYSLSGNRDRLLLLVDERIVLAAPRKRVMFRDLARGLGIIAEFSLAEVRLRPAPDHQLDSSRFRLHFADGAWLGLSVEAPDRVRAALTRAPEITGSAQARTTR